jgi:hypothetical protein
MTEDTDSDRPPVSALTEQLSSPSPATRREAMDHLVSLAETHPEPRRPRVVGDP